jgi:hypothetical protein
MRRRLSTGEINAIQRRRRKAEIKDSQVKSETIYVPSVITTMGRVLTGAQLGPQVWCSAEKQPFDRKKFMPPSGIWVKPKDGGVWSSSFIPRGEFCSGWHEWTQRNEFMKFELDQCWMLTPDSDARIYQVNTLEDLVWLVKNYAVDYRETDLDWTKIAKDFDAVRLTEGGQWATRLTHPNLYGWDAESTVWLKPRFTVRRFTTDEAVCRPKKPAR